ncbi:rhodopsin, GQ-coupled-like [Glandiceps talaboti]
MSTMEILNGTTEEALITMTTEMIPATSEMFELTTQEMTEIATSLLNTTNMTDCCNNTNTSIIPPTDRPQFAPRQVHYIIAVVLIISGSIGFFGNAIVLFVFTKAKYLRTPGNMLIVNLALSDWLMSITNFPPFIASSFNEYWMFGKLGCELYGFAGGFCGFISIYSITMISYDRYYVICKPMRANQVVTKRRSLKFIVCIWLYALLWSGLPWVGVGQYMLEGYATSCTFDYVDNSRENVIYVMAMYIGGFLLPVGWIISCYGHMVYRLRKHRKELDKIQDNVGKQSTSNKTHEAMLKASKEAKAEFKLAKIGMIVVICFMISWLPYAIMAAISLLLGPKYITPTIQTLPVVIAKSYCAYNPVVYALTHVKFKKAIREQCPCLSCFFPAKKPTVSSSRTSETRARSTNKATMTSASQSSFMSSVSDVTDMSDAGIVNPTADVDVDLETNPQQTSAL